MTKTERRMLDNELEGIFTTYENSLYLAEEHSVYLLRQGEADAKTIREVYVNCLGREPYIEEWKQLLERI